MVTEAIKCRVAHSEKVKIKKSQNFGETLGHV